MKKIKKNGNVAGLLRVPLLYGSWELREEQLLCCVTLDLLVSKQAVGIPNTKR